MQDRPDVRPAAGGRMLTAADVPSVGPTPEVPLRRLFEPVAAPGAKVFAKLETANPTGSAKDRSAAGLVADAIERGVLQPGTPVVESSSGNLALAVARLGAMLGFRFHCVVDPRTSARTIQAIRAFGAEVHPVTEPDEATGDWLVARLNHVQHLLAELPGAVNLDQYGNQAAPRAHELGTMTEVVDHLGAPDVMYVATSTTGTIGGCQRLVEARSLNTRLVAVDAAGSVLFQGTRGRRLLSGYGAGIVPRLAESVRPHHVARVEDLDAVVHCRALALAEGILAGGSTGAIVAAAHREARDWPDDATVVLVVHDGGQAYLDTIYDDDWVQREFGVTPAQLDEKVAAVVEGVA